MKIAAIISGFGLGNSSRVHLYLSQNYASNTNPTQVTIIGSNNSLEFFKAPENQIDHLKIDLVEQLSTEYSLKGNILLRVLSVLAIQLPKLFLNGCIQFSFLIKNKPSLIIVDSDYSSWLWKFFIRAPVTAINSAPHNVKIAPQKISLQYLFEWLENIYFRIFADTVICPILSESDHFQDGKVSTFLFRNQSLFKKKKNTEIKNIVVLMSGSKNDTLLQLMEKASPELKKYKISILGKAQSTLTHFDFIGRLWGQKKNEVLLEADLLIIHGGFSSIMESLSSLTPTLCLPLSNHHEQINNAQSAARFPHFRITNEENFVSDLKDMIKNYSHFQK